MAGLLNSNPYGGGLLGNPLQAGLLGQNALTNTYSQPNNVDRFLGGLTRLPFAIAEGIGNRVMQAHEAMPWGGNNPAAIGIDPRAGTIDPSVMVPFATDVAGMATTGALAAPAMKNATGMGIRAYHGSPHDFDRFSMDKIGTGEGAQAYGHGLYFAENPGVAGEYRKQLTRRDGGAKMVTSYDVGGKHIAQSSPDWPAADVAGIMRQHGIDPSTPDGMDWLDSELGARRMSGVINDTDAARAKVLDFYEADDFKSETVPGRMYEVEINASPDEFLDWDKPLSEQPENIRRALGWTPEAEAAYNKAVSAETDSLLAELEGRGQYQAVRPPVPKGLPPLSATGADLVKGGSVFDRASDKTAADRLRAAGIKGIRYKDAGSRGTDSAGGTSNYVVFDDNIIDILRKYGIAGLTAGGAGAAMLGGTQDASAAPTSYSTGGRF